MKHPEILVIVPLRLASTRVPRKILKDIQGQTLAARTLGQVRRALGADPEVRIVAAVDAEETALHLVQLYPDLEVIVTDPALPSGTDRVFAASRIWLAKNPGARLKGVINVQGDMPFAGVQGLRAAAAFYKEAGQAELARFGMITLAQTWPRDLKLADPGSVKVLADREGGAIYFSRYPIPYSRKEPTKERLKDASMPLACDLHIGVYGYTLENLARLSSHAPVEIESCESLEQLRALWLGIRILVIRTDPATGEDFRGIDTPKDLAWAKRFALRNKAKAAPSARKPARGRPLKTARKRK